MMGTKSAMLLVAVTVALLTGCASDVKQQRHLQCGYRADQGTTPCLLRYAALAMRPDAVGVHWCGREMIV